MPTNKINKQKLLNTLESVKPGLANRDVNGTKPKRELRDFARWVNTHRTLYSCSWEKYKQKIGYK